MVWRLGQKGEGGGEVVTTYQAKSIKEKNREGRRCTFGSKGWLLFMYVVYLHRVPWISLYIQYNVQYVHKLVHFGIKFFLRLYRYWYRDRYDFNGRFLPYKRKQRLQHVLSLAWAPLQGSTGDWLACWYWQRSWRGPSRPWKIIYVCTSIFSPLFVNIHLQQLRLTLR